MRWVRLVALLVLLLGSGEVRGSESSVVRYVTPEGVLTFVPRPWMVPVSLQSQLPAEQRNPYPVYDLNGSYTFTLSRAEGNLTLLCSDSEERIVPYALGLPPAAGEKFLRQADDYLRSVVGTGRTVQVVLDDTQRDQSGRLLAYLFADGMFLNAEMLTVGQMAYLPPDKKPRYDEFLRRGQDYAREHLLGIWAALAKRELTQQLDGVYTGPVEMPVIGDQQKRYHTLFCELGKGGDPITRHLALELGYQPCPKCHPVPAAPPASSENTPSSTPGAEGGTRPIVPPSKPRPSPQVPQ